jgi:hypothetical protein
MTTKVKVTRSLNTIANEIYENWNVRNSGTKLSPYAEPYLSAMSSLDSINDNYMLDSGRSIVAYFLGNATSWKGEKAREIKKELNAMLKSR